MEARASGEPRDGVRTSGTPGEYRKLIPEDRPAQSWLRPSVLWQSRNHMLARLGDTTAEDREAFLSEAKIPPGPDRASKLAVKGHEERSTASFLVLGDPGEGDGSQMAVVPGLQTAGRDTNFMVVCSDVIYPAGDANDYLEKFAFPYREFPGPIYAIPGNHDWYDRLSGFMVHFRGVEGLPTRRPTGLLRNPRAFLRDLLWRTGPKPDPAITNACKLMRPPRDEYPPQSGSYWSLDTADVRLVAIDTGILHELDRHQGDWLREISRSGHRKILLTGSPLMVDGREEPCKIEGGGSVLDVVCDAGNNYVAAIGGDIHNYQRYPAARDDGRTVQFIVSGGGGAFLHATYRIPNIDELEEGRLKDVKEVDLRLFPTRGRSLSEFTSKLFGGGEQPHHAWWRSVLAPLALTTDEAAAVVAVHLDLEPVEESAKKKLEWARRSPRAKLAKAIFLDGLPGPGRIFQRLASEALDWDVPTMYKQFLRIDVTADQVRIGCYAATGWLEDERDPPLVDEVEIPA